MWKKVWYVNTVWKLVVAWTPLAALLLMAFVSAVILNKIVNCEDRFTGVKESITERACIPHEPQVTPHQNLESQSPLVKLDKQPFAELRGRLTWSISMLFFALAITVTFAAIFRTVIDTLGSFRLLPGIIIVFLIAGIMTGLSLPSGQTFKFNDKFLKATVFRVAPAEGFVDAVEVTGPMALVGVAIAVSLILLHINRMSTSKPELTIAAMANILARHQRRVRLLLYVGALTLVAGTLQSSALYSWAVSMLTLPEGSTYANLSDIPQAMGILNGSFYSIFLAGIFLPAMAQLRAHAHRFADMAKPEASAAERNKWLEENAIEGTVPRQVITAFAVTAPLLAGGPLVSLLELAVG